jgi:hypothetical protein
MKHLIIKSSVDDTLETASDHKPVRCHIMIPKQAPHKRPVVYPWGQLRRPGILDRYATDLSKSLEAHTVISDDVEGSWKALRDAACKSATNVLKPSTKAPFTPKWWWDKELRDLLK